MVRKTKSITADSVQAPQTKEEAELLLSQIGRLQRENQKHAADMDAELSGVKERWMKRMDSVNEMITDCFRRLYVWAEANRAKLLPGKAKTAVISSGKIAWRNSPPSVKIKDAKKAIDELKASGLQRFIRTVEEVDKEAILREPDAVQDVVWLSVASKELFVAQPHETNVEKVEAVDKL